MAKETGSKAVRASKPAAKKKAGASSGASGTSGASRGGGSRASKPRAAASSKKPAKKPAAAKKPPSKKPAPKPAKPGAKKPPAKPAPKASKTAPKAARKPPPKSAPKPASKPEKKPGKGPKPLTITDKKDKKKAPSKPAPATPTPKAKAEAPPRTVVSIADARDAAARMRESAGLALVKTDSTSDADMVAKRSRTTKTPLTKKEMDEFRQLLIMKRAEIAGDVSAMETEALTGGGSGSLSNLPQHMADQGSDAYDQSLSLDLAASQRKLLKEIDDALERIDNGAYGVCEMTGKPIGKARLNAKPWAKYSIEAARQLEYRPYMR